MTPEQFDALAELLRLRDGQARECASLVMVDGLRINDAAERSGLKYRTAAAAVKRARDGLELARKAVL